MRIYSDISYIPAGASDHPLGGLGFTNMMLEIASQESELGIFFDTLIICSVTGSSHAGCVVGAVAEGRKRNVIGIDASAKPAATKAQVLRIARNTAKLLDTELEIMDEDVILDERFHAGVYGIPDQGTIEAMRRKFGDRLTGRECHVRRQC
jgi:1-aminocyclopropane-1-carboxylate deaminase